jgi:hypothetical protein
MAHSDLPDYAVRNRELWTLANARHTPDWEAVELSTEFHIGAGELIRLLRRSGFEILELVELFAPEDAVDHPYYTGLSAEWAKRWPGEEIWRARKRT